MYEIIENLKQYITHTQGKIITTVIFLMVFWIMKLGIQRIINSRVENLRHRYIWRQVSSYIIYVLLLIALTVIWFRWFQSILTALTLVIGALTIVCKELILNVVANLVIVWRGLFDVGDRIQIGTETGDVMEIGPVFITVSEIGNWVKGDEPTGRIIKIPNAKVLTNSVANYTRAVSMVWNELTFEITSDSDKNEAKRIILEIAEKYSEKIDDENKKKITESGAEFMFKSFEPVCYTQIKDSKLTVLLRYPIKFHKRRESEMMIMETLYDTLKNSESVKLVIK
ncbi:MAG: mechanosensitive ion channel [Deltaproteobacteria bacterium]|nr:mechanosensitive ion channel [Deltaproteobacteria bacterium]